MFGCVTWSASKADYDTLHNVHDDMILRCLGWQKRNSEDQILSYGNALLKTDSGAFETTVRRRMISPTGFVVRMGEELSLIHI